MNIPMLVITTVLGLPLVIVYAVAIIRSWPE